MYQNLNTMLVEASKRAEIKIYHKIKQLEVISASNHYKVLNAFQAEKVGEHHFHGTTGYGIDDQGRDTLDRVYARIFNTESALVRTQIVSGTHAIALCLYGILKPGDEMLSVTGQPYDTLEELIGIRGNEPGSLRDYDIGYRQIELDTAGKPRIKQIAKAIRPETKLVAIQRSRGYTWRNSLGIEDIGKIIVAVKAVNPDIICFVDNCYGELVEANEPTDVGADLVAGSLIKNLGGGIVPAGGYVAGKAELVQKAANRLTAPGIGSSVGASLGFNRLLYQGLYLAPATICESLAGAIYAAALFEELGIEVSPASDEQRTDLIQGIKVGSPEAMVAFCRGLQKGSPIDSHVSPEPSGMPGYGDQVVMAGGTFIDGATSELSADGPIREPYAVYLQGGLSQQYVKIGVLTAAQSMVDEGLLKP